MSEAELYLIRQRMLSGKLAKAERGELAIPLPIGYVRRPSGEVILDPDEQAQHVVRLVFDTFARLGTLNGVLRYLVEHQVQLPVRVQAGPGQGRDRVAAPEPGDAADHAAQPGLRRVLRLRAPPGRAAQEGTGPAQHRAGGERQRRVAGAAAGPAARLHHPRSSTRPTWRGWRPTGRPPPRRARRGTARRCCPGCCAAAAAASTA